MQSTGPTVAPVRVVEVARRGAKRTRQLRELANHTADVTLELRWPRVFWLDVALTTSALLAGTHCPEFSPEDEQACFEQYASALAGTGASWRWLQV